MVLSEGINWLFTGNPEGHHSPYSRPSSVIGGGYERGFDSPMGMSLGGGMFGDSFQSGFDRHHYHQEDEYYVSERVHAYLKSMQYEMRSVCEAPMDVVFHHYIGGSFSRPNGFIYDQSKAGRTSNRKGRCLAIITMAEDPRQRFGSSSYHQSTMPSPYLQECAMECIMLNKVEGIIVTDGRSYMFVHVDDMEPWGVRNRMVHKFQQVRKMGDPRYAPMIRVTYAHSMWGRDTTRRQLMYLVKSAHRNRLTKRHNHLHSAGKAMAAMQMV